MLRIIAVNEEMSTGEGRCGVFGAQGWFKETDGSGLGRAEERGG